MAVVFSTFLLHLLGGDLISGNESELLTVTNLQAASLPLLKDILTTTVKDSNNVHAVAGIFAQQINISPEGDDLQLPSFGALIPWPEILHLAEDPSRILLVMVRHGQAWENLNPYGNDLCEFDYEGETIQNFDSALSPAGEQQAQDLNSLLRSPAPSDQSPNDDGNASWYEAMGLGNTPCITSPLTRTLQTAMFGFDQIPVPAFIASEIVRASIGHDVCNFRHSVSTPTDEATLVSPWNTGCTLPHEALSEIYRTNNSSKSSNSSVLFKFPIRPPGGEGFGLVSDSDTLWRSDVVDDTQVSRGLTFLSQLFDNKGLFDKKDGPTVVGLVTHGEMIQAIYEAIGEVAYSAKNTQVVPLLLELR